MSETPRVPQSALFLIFFRIGSLAFGSGGSTLAMMHDEFCVRRYVVPEDEFQVFYGLSRVVPGMNLLSMTVLLGHRMHGFTGAIIALAGLTVPCFALITLACWLLRGHSVNPMMTGAIRGLAPAVTILLGYTLWQLCEKSVRRSEGSERLCWLGILLVTAVLTVIRVLHPALSLAVSAALGISLFYRGNLKK